MKQHTRNNIIGVSNSDWTQILEFVLNVNSSPFDTTFDASLLLCYSAWQTAQQTTSPVKQLRRNLPFVSLPADLPLGKYQSRRWTMSSPLSNSGTASIKPEYAPSTCYPPQKNPHQPVVWFPRPALVPLGDLAGFLCLFTRFSNATVPLLAATDALTVYVSTSRWAVK